MSGRTCRRLAVLVALVALIGPLIAPAVPVGAYAVAGSYKGTALQNCPDPATTNVRGADGVTHWYMYCTADPLNDADRLANGGWNYHLMAILHSTDLVTWNYVSDVFSRRPRWVAATAGLWAPEIQLVGGKWYLYYTVANQAGTGRGRKDGVGSAIGVATSTSPTGPWTDSGGPVVEAQPGRWVYDPAVVLDDYGVTPTGKRYIVYGSFAGGISIRTLSADGLHGDPASERAIAAADRFEASYVVKRGGFYYLFVSSSDCCNSELTGYSVFVGRAQSLFGPYLDREGVPLLPQADGRVGGTPVLSMNGNRWVGPGHNSVVTDYAGQDWFAYHAVNRAAPDFANTPGYTKRAPLLDPLDWVGGWPTVRGGLGASDSIIRPAAQTGQTASYVPTAAPMDTPSGTPLPDYSDEFVGPLGPQWAAVRAPSSGNFAMDPAGGAFVFDVQARDLHKDQKTASLLVEGTPMGDYLVETKVALNVPGSGGGYNYAAAGLVIYGDDDNYIKLVQVAINGTRQTEFAKEIPTGPQYGSTTVGPPGETTYLRIAKRTNPANAGEELYTAYTSRDGATWVRGGAWTHTLGRVNAAPKIGLVAMGGGGYTGPIFTARFDYVRVFTLAP